jgi:hypothetical protein
MLWLKATWKTKNMSRIGMLAMVKYATLTPSEPPKYPNPSIIEMKRTLEGLYP